MTAPRPVEGPWALALTAPGAFAGPADLARAPEWIPAPVPGTVAGALAAAGRWSIGAPTPLHDRDAWYRTRLVGRGREVLRFEGLATLAEAWLDGRPLLASRSMFRACSVEIDLDGEAELVIAFRALAPELARPTSPGFPRARWRPRLATPGALRGVRTTLIGHMPGWCPAVDAVGPYRPITRAPLDAGPCVIAADLRPSLEGATGRLAARLHLAGVEGPVHLRCDGREVSLAATAPGRFAGDLLLPDVAPWWPHTHGAPRLHAVEVLVGGTVLDLGRTGFRAIEVDRDGGGFALRVNGIPVFCRGACWTPPDPVGLAGDRAAYEPTLRLAREAGMNMLRVGGTMLYESRAFHDLCDAFGILVWQDLMLANFDYPLAEPAFRAELEAEVEDLLARTQLSPSLAVLCGGSEVAQQAAMLGAPRATWAATFGAEALPGIVAARRPDLAVVADSPWGGDPPFSVGEGVAHYYGVGAYRRPLEDARRAGVRFASECLAFANVPEPATLAARDLAPGDPRWAAGVPRDRGAAWDFEDVRDHYAALLYGEDPARLRRVEPNRWLAVGRAAVVEVMEATFAEWRRAGSPCAGGLVWFLRDLAPGPGWGVIDSDGRPKAAWYALRRALRPLGLSLTDEGLDGLRLHVHNDGPLPRDLALDLAFLDGEGRTVAGARRAITAPARTTRAWTSADLLGRFYDAAHAYRFGPPAHAVARAALLDADGTVLAEALHLPAGRDAAPRAIGLEAALVADARGPALRIRSRGLALGVAIDAGAGRPEDNHFHLAPGAERLIALLDAGPAPRGRVRALNATEVAAYGRDAAGRDADGRDAGERGADARDEPARDGPGVLRGPVRLVPPRDESPRRGPVRDARLRAALGA